MQRTKRALVIAVFTLVSCSTPVLPASTPTTNVVTLRLYTTTATIPLADDLIRAYSQTRPGVRFDVLRANYEITLERLLAGEAPYFLTNHLPLESDLWAAPIGQDGIAVIAHPDNPVGGLTTAELRRVYQGHIANWNELGGPDLRLIVISREVGSGTRVEFERLVMGQRRTTSAAQLAPSSAAMIASVAQQPGSIGYVSMGYLDQSVRAVPINTILPTPNTVYDNIYPLRANLYIVGQNEPQGAYFDFIGWVQSQAGQAVVGQRYAPLLRP